MIKWIYDKLWPPIISSVAAHNPSDAQLPESAVKHEPTFVSFNSDRATAEDALGRKKFAEDIGSAIATRSGEDSIAIAIYGPWGSGKSTIKELMLAHFVSMGKKAPQVLEFNPWYWNGQDQLFDSFFNELERAYCEYEGIPLEVRNNISRTLKSYKHTLSMGTAIARTLGVSAMAAGQPGIAAAASLAAIGTDSVSNVLYHGSALANEPPKNIGSQKKAIADLLRSLPRPVVVVMDDIDRLDSNEIKEIMKLVKANADFPNIVYLLLMDRDYVEGALSTTLGDSRGKQYLEKIVQVGFDLPLLGERELKAIIGIYIDRYRKHSSIDFKLDETRLDELLKYSDSLIYFKQLRDVKRFFSMLSFQANSLIINNEFEVDFVDLFGIELLRVFEPDIYHQIAVNRLVFSGADRLDLVAFAKLENEDFLSHSLLPIVDLSINKPAVLKILKVLFPNIQHGLPGGTKHHSDHYSLLANKRICTNEYFERYFRFQLGKYEVLESEFRSFIANCADSIVVLKALCSYDDAGKLQSFLDKLSSSDNSALFANAVHILRAMSSFYDKFQKHSIGSMILWQSGWRLISKISEENRDQMIRELYISTEPLMELPMHWLSVDIAERARRGNVIPEALQNELKKYLAEKIKTTINSEEYRSVSINKLGVIFQFWEEWGTLPDITTWMAELSDSPQGFMRILRLYKSSGPDFEKQGRIHEYIKFHDMIKYMPIVAIHNYLDKHTNKYTDEEDKRLFTMAVESYTKYCTNNHLNPKDPAKSIQI